MSSKPILMGEVIAGHTFDIGADWDATREDFAEALAVLLEDYPAALPAAVDDAWECFERMKAQRELVNDASRGGAGLRR